MGFLLIFFVCLFDLACLLGLDFVFLVVFCLRFYLFVFLNKKKKNNLNHSYPIQGKPEHKGRRNSDKYIRVPMATYWFY